MVKVNKILTTGIIGVTLTVGFTGCFNSNTPRPNVTKYIQQHKLLDLPKNKNLEIIGLINNNTCDIEKINDIVSKEYKAYDITKQNKNFFVGKGRVYQAATHNPTPDEVGRCYGALTMQQAYGRYRAREQANWYINECIKGFKKIRTFDNRIKVKHGIVKNNHLVALKINISNANLDDTKNEIGIYKNHNNLYLYTILTSFDKSKMKNFDKKITKEIEDICIVKKINIPKD